MDETDRIEIELPASQLGRMRGMQYAYSREFFALLLCSVVAIAVGFAAGPAVGPLGETPIA